MGQTVWDAALGSLIADERLKEGYAYWRRKAPGAKPPRRADFDPIEIPHLLPHILLVDVLEHGRFRYRLVATETRQQQKSDPTGRFLDEVLSPPSGPRIIEVYAECVCDRRPIYVEHEFIQPRRLSAVKSALHASVRGRYRCEPSSRVSRAGRNLAAATGC
jgi:hypothetical protein